MSTKATEEDYKSIFTKLNIKSLDDLGNNEQFYEELSFADLLMKAEYMKDKGNLLFKKNDYDGAKALYTAGLDALKVASNYIEDVNAYSHRQYKLQLIKAALLGNRGFMFLKMNRFFDAIRDFTNCIYWCQKPNYVTKLPSHQSFRLIGFTTMETKAVYRRSLAFRELGNHNQALIDVTDILGMLGTDGLRQGVPDDIRETAFKDLSELSVMPQVAEVTNVCNKHDKRLLDMGPKWNKIKAVNRIEGRQGHTACYWGGCIFVLGGQDPWHRAMSDFNVFDLTEKEWKCLPAPRDVKGRYGHTVLVSKDQMYIYGGNAGKEIYLGTCWKFDFKTQEWSKWNSRSYRKTNSPCVQEHSACLVGNTMYIFGGRGIIGERKVEHSCNLYALDLNKHGICKKLSGYDDNNPLEKGLDFPEPRYNHASWADVPRERIYIFGGTFHRPNVSCEKHKHAKKLELPIFDQNTYESNHHTLEDFFYYNIPTGQWTRQDIFGNFPASRCQLGYVATTQGALIFGGFTGAVKTSVDFRVGENHETCYWCRYLGDTFHFMRKTDSFCMVPDYGITSRAKTVLVNDGKDKIYAVQGYHGCQNTKPHVDPVLYDDVYVIDLRNCDPKLDTEIIRMCEYCKLTSNQEKLRKCAGKCGGRVYYCSKQCQKIDWKNHKPHCI